MHPSEFRQHEQPSGNHKDDRRKYRPGADPGDRRRCLSIVVRYGGRRDQWKRLRMESRVTANGLMYVHGD